MSFKDTPTEKFFQFFHRKIRNEETSAAEIAKKFKKYEANPNVLLNGMKSGKNGVTIELILLAEQHFGLNPCSLFEKKANIIDKTSTKAADDNPPQYGNDSSIKMLDIIAQQSATIAQQQATIAALTANKATGNRRASA